MASTKNDPFTLALLKRLLLHDPEAWNELVEMYSGLLLSIVRRTFIHYGFTPANADVEDKVAEVWQNLLANEMKIIRQCIHRGYFLQTLHTLARHRTIDMLRKRKLETVPLDGHEPAIEAHPETASATWDLHSPLLHQALETLSAKERAMIALFFLQKKKYKEIASLTGIAQNSIGPTIGRALIKLRACAKIISQQQA